MPHIILTSQFTTPDAKSFVDYVNYVFRKEALLEKEKQEGLSKEEKRELAKLEKAIENYEMKAGKTYSPDKNEEMLSELETEAKKILGNGNVFKSDELDFDKYISYMTRQYALEQKKERTETEEKELQIVKKKALEYQPKYMVDIGDEKDNLSFKKRIVPGSFSNNKEKITFEDLDEIKNIVKNAQNNGSIFFQDVISFETDFLIKEKIYNPKTNELDEQKIQAASKKMMDKMFKDEKIEKGFWFASIHRNTDNIHIHFGAVESQNTRKLMTVKRGGQELKVPKGKRKQNTIDNMKSTFANALVDRTAELSRITELRNSLAQDIVKNSYHSTKKELEQVQLLTEIYNELPENKRNWNYEGKNGRCISNTTREKLDRLTESLVGDNPSYQKYINETTKEGEYRKNLYGDSSKYTENQIKDIKKRLGNSLLKEMKKDAYSVERNRKVYNTHMKKATQESRGKEYKPPIIRRANLYHLKRALHDDIEKYRAEKDYERLQERIAYEQERNRI